MAQFEDVVKIFGGIDTDYSMPQNIDIKKNNCYIYNITGNTTVNILDDLSYIEYTKIDTTKLHPYATTLLLWQNTDNTSVLSIKHNGIAIPISGTIDPTKCNVVGLLRLPVSGVSVGAVIVAKVIALMNKHVATYPNSGTPIDPDPNPEPAVETVPSWTGLSGATDNAGVIEFTANDGYGMHNAVFNKVDGNYVSIEYEGSSLTPSVVIALSDSSTPRAFGDGAWIDHGIFYNPGSGNDLATVYSLGNIINEASELVGQVARMRIADGATNMIYEYTNDDGATWTTVRTESIVELGSLYLISNALTAGRRGVIKILNATA